MKTIASSLQQNTFDAAERQGYSHDFVRLSYGRWERDQRPDVCVFLGQKGPPALCTCDSCRMMLLFNFFDSVATNFAMIKR